MGGDAQFDPESFRDSTIKKHQQATQNWFAKKYKQI